MIAPVNSKTTLPLAFENAGFAWPRKPWRRAALAALCFAAPCALAQTYTSAPAAPAASPAAKSAGSWTPLAVPPAPNLPNLGDTSREDLSPAMERKIGEEIMRGLRGDRDYLDDAPLLEYLLSLIHI